MGKATNPKLTVEVLSPRTEAYDRGDKFEPYKRIATLEQYMLVSHREREIEVWSRAATGDWTPFVARAGGIVALTSIAASLVVEEVYDVAAEPV